MPTIPAPPTLSGFDVLQIAPASVDGSTARESLLVADDAFAGPHGASVLTAPAQPMANTRTLQWACRTRAELATLTDFLARRRGRLVPFWCPTWRQDAIITATSGGSWTARRSRYAEAFAGLASARNGGDWWAASAANGAWRYARATSVTTTSTEMSLIFAGGTIGSGSGTTADGTRYMRLELCRLTDDAWSVDYVTGAVALVNVAVVTVPGLTP